MNRLRVIRQLLRDTNFHASQAATILGLSVRQVFRLKARVRLLKAAGIPHRNRGRTPRNAKPLKLRDRVLALYKRKFFDYNITHFTETLAEEYSILLSRETIRCWLRSSGLGPPPRHSSRPHRRRRERRARFGELVFLDGSLHHWLGIDRHMLTLILATDDATGMPLHGLFAPQETLDACLEVFYHVACRHGLPTALYLDRAGQFTTTRHGGVHRFQRDDKPTHFETAMQTLLVGTIFADSPQARGRGERINGSFQGRLVAELRHKGIKTAAAATDYLNRVFIPKYARRFGVAPRDPSPAFRPVPKGIDLRHVLCAKHSRTVSNDDTISYQGHSYQLLLTSRRISLIGAKVEVQAWFDGSTHVFHPRAGEIPIRLLPKARINHSNTTCATHDVFALQRA
ncbi:MAG: ISNCY family transposase [candidate division WOR-3 bacterium]|nr:MAG: ISNCY family transposase [candidate division WOR-3 bacterium]